MGLSPRLEVRQSQSLTLTPQLMQSIRLLQLSHLELNAFVEAELLRNPLLEREDGAEPGEADRPTARAPPSSAPTKTPSTTPSASSPPTRSPSSYDTEVENVFPEQGAGCAPSAISRNERGSSAMAGEAPTSTSCRRRPTLAEHLSEQIGLHLIRDPGRAADRPFLVDGLNEAGYLAVELEAVADQLGAPLETVEAVLRQLQGCDPVGVFARDVRSASRCSCASATGSIR
jgi:RNA polymerase sigma-54 factor